MALLNNQDLWYGLSHENVSNALTWWIDMLKSWARFNQAISILHNFSLLEVSTGQYSLHMCEHDWTLKYLNNEFDQKWGQITIHCIAVNVSEKSEAEYWIKNRWVLSHARQFEHNWIKAAIDWSIIAPGDLHMLAYLYQQNNMSAEAEKMYQRALNEKEKAWGPDHTFTLHTVNNLSLLYADQGKHSKAEMMYQRALNEYKKAWGPDHPFTPYYWQTTLA